jgi:hypothetical protein
VCARARVSEKFAELFNVHLLFIIKGFAWVRRNEARLGYGVAGEIIVAYPSLCQRTCFMDDNCDSVNYRPSDRTCQLITQYSPSAVNYTDIITDRDWEWWSNEFTEIIA